MKDVSDSHLNRVSRFALRKGRDCWAFLGFDLLDFVASLAFAGFEDEG